MRNSSDEQAFYYVDGVPTKGIWIDLDGADEDSIKEELAVAGLIPRDEDDEPDYDGDLLVATTEGELAPHFLSRFDCFDLEGFTDCMDDCDRNKWDYAAAAAYLSYANSWSQSDFESAYCGEAESETKFVEQLLDDTGDMNSIPEWARMYFDYESYARDLFIGDYTLTDGHVFRRN